MSTDTAPRSRPWRWLVAASVLGNIALNYYSNTQPFNGQTMGMVSAKYPTLLTPAGYAFAIWGIIFLGLAAYAVWQLLPAQQRLALPDLVAKPLTIANLGMGVWVWLFAHEMITASVAVMAVILFALMLAYGTARPIILRNEAPHWVGIPLALNLGWISVATVINFTIGLQHLGLQPSQEISVYLAYALVVVVVGLGLILSAGFQERTFPVVFAWALVGIWLARLREEPTLGWVALAAAVVVFILGLVMAQQGRKRQPWEVASAAAASITAPLEVQ